VTGIGTTATTVKVTVTDSSQGTPAASASNTASVSNGPTAPTPTVQPTAQSQQKPGSVTFSADATDPSGTFSAGGTDMTAKWYVSTDGGTTFNPDNVDSNSTTGNLMVTSTSQYYVTGDKFEAKFTNTGGTGTSNSAALTLTTISTCTIGTQPTAQSVVAPNTATFTASCTGGTGTSTPQWQVSTNGGATWSNDTTDTGNNTGSLTTSPTAVTASAGSNPTTTLNGYEYRAGFTNSAGTTYSNAVKLTVSGSAFAAGVELDPSSTQASGVNQTTGAPDPDENPALQTLVNFSYPNSTDTVKSVTLDLAPGVLANPTVVTECTQANFNANALADCPSSVIGTGTATANATDAHGDGGSGTVSLPVKLFLIQQPAGDPSALAQIGLVAYLDGVPEVTQQTGAALSTDPNHQGSVALTFNSIPSSVTIGSSTVNVQITSLNVTISPTVDGNDFTIQTANCTNSSVTSVSATDTSSASSQGTSEFIATGCDTPTSNLAPYKVPVQVGAVQSSTAGSNTADFIGQFQLNPSNAAAGGNPSLSTIFDFTYADAAQGKLGGGNTAEPTSELYLPSTTAKFKWSTSTPTTLTVTTGTVPTGLQVGDAVFGNSGVPSGSKIVTIGSTTLTISKSVTTTNTTGSTLTIVTSAVAAASSACTPGGTSTALFQYTCHVANSATALISPSLNTTQEDSGTGVCADMMMLTYSNSTPNTGSGNCEWLKSFSVNLAPGVLANPDALKEYCPYAQWNTFSNAPNGATSTGPACPSDTEIASGHAAANTYDDPADGNNGNQNALVTNLYLLPPDPTIPTELARVGATVTLSGVPVTGVLGSATLLTDGQVQLSFPSVPQAAYISGLLEYVQINRLALTVASSVPRPVTNVAVTGTVTPGSATVTSVSSLTGLTVGDQIDGTDVPANAVISSITPPSTITISQNALGSGAALTGNSLTVEQGIDITGTTTSGQPQVTGISNTSNLAVGDLVTGVGIPTAATVQSVDSSSQITLNVNATASGSTALDVTPTALFTVNPPGCETAVSSASASGLTDTLTNSVGATMPATASTETINMTSAFDPINCTLGDAGGGSPAVAPSAPAVVTNPSDQYVTAPSTASFSSKATGEEAPTAQWQYSQDGGTTWTQDTDPNDSGATTPTLTVAPGSAAYVNGTQFQNCFTNSSGGPVCTSAATLHLTAQPAAFSAAVQAYPSTFVEGGNPTVYANAQFSYPNSTDTVSSATVTLGSGLLANPDAVQTRCTSTQLMSYSCPAVSQIGQGFVTANLFDKPGETVPGVTGKESLPASIFLMPEPAGQTQVLAQVGVEIFLDGQGIVYLTGNASLNASGQVQIAFTGLPSQVTINGTNPVTVAAQVLGLSLAINAQAGSPASAFTIDSSECVLTTSTLSATDDAATPATATASYAFTPTGCPPQNANPVTFGSASLANGHLASTFSLVPDDESVNGNPNLTTTAGFTYYDSNGNVNGEANCSSIVVGGGQCEWLKDAQLTLAPGILANPGAATTVCTQSQFTTASAFHSTTPCPAASQIGFGSVSGFTYDVNKDGGNGVENNLQTNLYILPSQNSGELAEVGLIIYLSGSPVVGVTGSATLTPSGQVQVTFTGLPTQAQLGTGGINTWVQLTKLSITVDQTVDNNRFTVNPSGCQTAISTLAVDSSTDPATSTYPLTVNSAFDPTGC
jgi:hypothetical protein